MRTFVTRQKCPYISEAPENIKKQIVYYGRPDASCFEHLLNWIDQIVKAYDTVD